MVIRIVSLVMMMSALTSEKLRPTLDLLLSTKAKFTISIGNNYCFSQNTQRWTNRLKRSLISTKKGQL